MKRLEHSFFYLLLALLPIQLGRHFFFDFSFISGIRSDYLTPTVYLTDIIVVLFISMALLGGIKNKKLNIIQILLLIIVCYLFFNCFYVASNHWVALYKLVKIIEFFLLGIAIIKIKPKFNYVIFFLSIGIVYSGIIAVWQVVLQRSVGGFLWFLGERTFYASTPGIAAVSLNGNLLLRPYATFPHPNVLGGFLAVLLPIVFFFAVFNKKNTSFLLQVFYRIVLVVGFVTLFLTFSRTAWTVTLLGFMLVFLASMRKFLLWFKTNNDKTLFGFYMLLLLSVIFFQFIPYKSESVFQRGQLIKAAIEMISQNPLFGVGLNNFVLIAKDYLPRVSDLYIFQPVHNVYLLILAELGLIGFVVMIFMIFCIFLQSLKSHPLVLVAVLEVVFLGFFDHYLFTLQQGQLFFTVIASLAFLREKN